MISIQYKYCHRNGEKIVYFYLNREDDIPLINLMSILKPYWKFDIHAKAVNCRVEYTQLKFEKFKVDAASLGYEFEEIDSGDFFKWSSK